MLIDTNSSKTIENQSIPNVDCICFNDKVLMNIKLFISM